MLCNGNNFHGEFPGKCVAIQFWQMKLYLVKLTVRNMYVSKCFITNGVCSSTFNVYYVLLHVCSAPRVGQYFNNIVIPRYLQCAIPVPPAFFHVQ